MNAAAPRVTYRRLLQFVSLLLDGLIVVAAFVAGVGPEVTVIVLGVTLLIWGPKSPSVLERRTFPPLPVLGTLGRWRMRGAGALGLVVFLVASLIAAPLPSPRESTLLAPQQPSVDTQLSATAHLAGNVSYATYRDSNCAANRQDAGRSAFTDGVIPPSKSIAFENEGTYWWRAEVDGTDSSRVASACTPLEVGRAPSAGRLFPGPFQLRFSSSAVGVGDRVTASVELSMTGVFALYRAVTCTGPAQAIAATGTGSIVTSRLITLSDAGSYGWKASLRLGDLELSHTPCVAMTVPKKSPRLVASPITAARIGVIAAPGLSLQGASSHATGDIRFNFFSDASCATGATEVGMGSAASGVIANGGPIPPAAGAYYWRASYVGDASNDAASSACLPITVAKNRPTITVAAAGAITAGRTLSDAARLTGATASATGSAELATFSDAACTTQASVAQGGIVTSGALPAIAVFEQVGSYPIRLRYGGDSNNDPTMSDCVVMTVRPATPSVTARLSVTNVAIGSPVGATTLLTQTTAGVSGTLTYGLFNDANCAGAAVATAGSGPVVRGATPASELKTFGNAGTAYWRVQYSGDANNAPASSECLPVTVAPNTPTVSLALSRPSVPIGQSVGASAELFGATASASGTVKYTLYNDSSCTADPPVDAGTKAVAAGRLPDSNGITFSGTGTAYWQAAYSGDSNNRRAVSRCAAVTVTKATPSIVALPSATSVTVGDAITVSARLSGTSDSPGGSVTYARTTDSACRTTTALGSRTVIGSLVGPSTSTPLAAVGTVYVQATYTGDGNNDGASSACVAVTVRQWIDPCGAPSNPFRYTFCGGALIYSPAAGFCSYFSCIASFGNGRGYVVQCGDGQFSNSGGISGSCSQHSGNRRALFAP